MEVGNWFLFVAGRTHPEGWFKWGDCGVGMTSYGPGIKDCMHGILYVVPSWCIPFVPESINQPELIKKNILRYYNPCVPISSRKSTTAAHVQWEEDTEILLQLGSIPAPFMAGS